MFLIADPVDPGVVPDSIVGGVNEQNLEEFEGGVLADPVRVEDSEGREFSANSLLGNGLVILLIFESGNSDGLELSADDSLGGGSLPVSPSDLHPIDNIALLGLVAQSPGFLDPRGFGDPVDGCQLPVLPSPHSLDELHNS